MRLLERKNADEFCLIECPDDQIPRYAILSHTWGKEEVTFEDLQNDTGKNKAGYNKIQFCGEQANKDGLKYFWVDTCCIDKKSSAELSEAINSMLRWYSEASECIAYLSDVMSDLGGGMLEEQFRQSRWFTRGWTLQELLAPRKLMFYDKDWKFIGDRQQWKSIIEDITNIHEGALTGDQTWINRYSVAQKMSWASKRRTTRPEDIAYSLMGMFNVNMPLLYGEGKKAFLRLQQEIIKDSDDQTIFCWNAKVPAFNPPEFGICGLLAPSPREFEFSYDYVLDKTVQVAEPYSMTNTGMRITGPVHQIGSDYRLVLRCYDATQSHAVLKLPLRKLHKIGDQYARISGGLPYREVDIRKFDVGSEMKTIYIKQEIPEQIIVQEIGKNIRFRLPEEELMETGFTIQKVFPPEQWDESAGIISAPKYEEISSSFANFTWHVSVALRHLSEGIAITAFLGYNGRDNTSWCKLFNGDFEADMEILWRRQAIDLETEDTTQTSSTVEFNLDEELREFHITAKYPEHLGGSSDPNTFDLDVGISSKRILRHANVKTSGVIESGAWGPSKEWKEISRTSKTMKSKKSKNANSKVELESKVVEEKVVEEKIEEKVEERVEEEDDVWGSMQSKKSKKSKKPRVVKEKAEEEVEEKMEEKVEEEGRRGGGCVGYVGYIEAIEETKEEKVEEGEDVWGSPINTSGVIDFWGTKQSKKKSKKSEKPKVVEEKAEERVEEEDDVWGWMQSKRIEKIEETVGSKREG
ncbi:hypothetical protein G7Y89_g9198 [Cudoniella acicularis]|uniref:Heterokaryon incompatibility domain-containing protein n=1 Tax=Cudoniella acicularis TaxID=354080 RepID=A0A8H4RF44_9HELO|nr:hypothetical protein G7Y89_g9198 [Cudoniella acicularis]